MLKAFCNHYNSSYVLISWVFLRGLALIYFIAFASMSIQIEGLVGVNGILPIASKLELISQFYPEQKLWIMPTIFWLSASDFMLNLTCYIGMGASTLLLLNFLPKTSLVVCYLLYLSLVKAGQEFTHFQWDVFLLETGFLAIFLSWGSGIIILLFRLLITRFMLMSGVVKIASGDPNWANLMALNFHYETQPLPTPIAYYVHHLPTWFHNICVTGVFFIELIVPFFVFLPRRFRLFACYSFILLQSAIIFTGNYNFFNLLAILLCLFMLEDRDISSIIPNRLITTIQQKKTVPGNIAHTCAGLWASLVILVCASHLWLYHANMPTFEVLRSMLRTATTFSMANNYGPFAVMTTTRNEIIVQGSNDARHWSDYQFKYKPGELDGGLAWVIPHQPRLDWQMWFAALGPARKGSWFDHFLIKLLQGSPQVLTLLAENPFPEKPPRYIRAMIFQYQYTSPKQRNDNSHIWQRLHRQIYWPTRTLEKR